MQLTLVSRILRPARLPTNDKIVKLHIQPTAVILSMRVDESVERYFDPDRTNRGSIDADGKDFELDKILQLTSFMGR